jgi:hypothetical protein
VLAGTVVDENTQLRAAALTVSHVAAMLYSSARPATHASRVTYTLFSRFDSSEKKEGSVPLSE